MSLDKAIASGKERRKPYRGSKAFDRSCRHGGSCPYCRGNRTYGNQKLWGRARELDQKDDDGTLS